jgi:hypothetical protein
LVFLLNYNKENKYKGGPMIDYGFINTPTGPATFRDEPDHEPPVKDPEPDIMSPQLYKNSIDRLGFRKKLEAMEREVDALKVTDSETAARAVAMAGQVASLGNRIKKASEIKLAPFKAIIKSVRDYCLPIEKQCDALKGKAEKKNLDWMIEQDRIRREAREKAEADARKIREEQEKKRKKAEAENRKPEPEITPVVPFVPSETKIETESGTQKLEYEMIAELVDVSKLPKACLKARWKFIIAAVQPWANDQIAAGNYDLPGFVVSKQPVQKTRTKR